VKNLKFAFQLGLSPAVGFGWRGKGQNSPHYTTQRGDLYLTVAIAPHSFFQFEGENLTCEVSIAPDEAALGAVIDVPTPDGAVKMNIPAGIRSGSIAAAAGQRLAEPKGRSHRSDCQDHDRRTQRPEPGGTGGLRENSPAPHL
jgi:DnaJ-class molecular chaperone